MSLLYLVLAVTLAGWAATAWNTIEVVIVSGVAAAMVGLAIRQLLARVVLRADRIEVHGVLKTRRLERSEVSSVEPGVVDAKGLAVWAPRMSLRDGRVLDIKQLGGYSSSWERPNRRVEVATQALQQWLSR